MIDAALEASMDHDQARAEQVNATSITCRRSPGGIEKAECVCTCPTNMCAALSGAGEKKRHGL